MPNEGFACVSGQTLPLAYVLQGEAAFFVPSFRLNTATAPILASDTTTANYVEPSNPGYQAITLSGSQVEILWALGSATANIGGISFLFDPYVGPAQTVYSWFISIDFDSVPIYGCNLEVPFPIPFAGGTLVLSPCTVTMANCGILPPPSPPNPFLQDVSFEDEVITGAPPNNYAYNPGGSPWSYVNFSGVQGAGSVFSAGNPPWLGSQTAFIQSDSSIRQTVNGAAGDYQIFAAVGQRASTAQPLMAVFVDGAQIDTFAPSAAYYQGYSSPSFSLSAGSHTIGFANLRIYPPTDSSLLLDAVVLVPAST